jgi:proton-translocating NADH-quinone oxidoreductase chain L
MSLLLLYLPLCSAVINGFGGAYLGHRGSTLLAPTLLGLTFGLALLLSYQVLIQEQVFYTFLAVGLDWAGYELRWALQYDALTAVMIVVVTSISWLVHIYATSYMATDPHLSRFLACLSFFTFFMLVLVTADNYFQLFVGWEGVGLCSYLLINFWYTRIQANKAALQALVVNKVGDFFLALAVMWLLNLVGTTDFSVVFALAPTWTAWEVNIAGWSLPLLEVLGVALLVAAMAKSAQVGLHTWLLSAMEGPTPVSALLHAATMVTAGVFLLLRSSPLLELAPLTLWLTTGVGAVTAFFAATSGLVQHDLKKIIALSTCSQLGYMFYACGLSQYSLSLFHLTNHAFFKALLFLGAGAVIHALQGEQDLRRMGGLAQIMPVTYVAMSLASIALMGYPFLSGFYSKDRILEAAWGHYSTMGHFTFWLTTAAAICTAIYSVRLLYWVFLSDTQAYKTIMQRAHEADELMLTPFRVLMLASVTSGYLLKDAFGGLGSDFLKESVAISLQGASVAMTSEFVPLYVKILPTVGTLLASLAALLFYHSPYYNWVVKAQMRNGLVYHLHFFLVKKWFWDIVYNQYVATSVFFSGRYLYVTVDQGYLEIYGPQGLARLLNNTGYIMWATSRRQIFAILSSFLLAVLVLCTLAYGHYWYVCFDTWLGELVRSGALKGTIFLP